jgi:7-cyano-7-deazaguanine synthase in queuosine biosynthesis
MTLSVHCSIQGYQSRIPPQQITFDDSSEPRLAVEYGLGPTMISPVGADLLDLAAVVFEVERQYSGRRRTNPPAFVRLQMCCREPKLWTGQALQALRDILYLLSGADWQVEFSGGKQGGLPKCEAHQPRKVEQIVLFSGGLDSLCGAATLIGQEPTVQLVSMYTRQKLLQQDLAKELGYSMPSQWRLIRSGTVGRGHSFYWRSFLFLTLAAVVADSWGARSVLQFENGILATAIPPSPSWAMTKHAHPHLHLQAARLFGALLGGEWHIQNPFLLRTKRECLHLAMRARGSSQALELAARTETCWYHWSNRIPGDKGKTPGDRCGVCVPCVIRRTALPGEDVYKDLMSDDVRNDPRLGVAFRSYYGFLERVVQTQESQAEFYEILPPMGRDLVMEGTLSLEDLHGLFLRFAVEFMDTFGFTH